MAHPLIRNRGDLELETERHSRARTPKHTKVQLARFSEATEEFVGLVFQVVLRRGALKGSETCFESRGSGGNQDSKAFLFKVYCDIADTLGIEGDETKRMFA